MMMLAHRLHDADVEFLEVSGSHRMVTGRVHVDKLLVKSQADLDKFKAMAARDEITFDESEVRIATAEERKALDEIPW